MSAMRVSPRTTRLFESLCIVELVEKYYVPGSSEALDRMLFAGKVMAPMLTPNPFSQFVPKKPATSSKKAAGSKKKPVATKKKVAASKKKAAPSKKAASSKKAATSKKKPA